MEIAVQIQTLVWAFASALLNEIDNARVQYS